MSNQPEQASEGAPEWMVSYADMITIMMAFFVVLYASTSASGSKDKGGKAGEEAKGGKEPTPQAGAKAGPPDKDAADPRLQRVFDSLNYRFGSQWTLTNCWIGGPAALRSPKGHGRGRDETQQQQSPQPGRSKTKEASVVLVAPKPGDNLVAGGRIFLDEDSAALGDVQKRQVREVAKDLAGKLQKIEIRGHTSRRPLPRASPYHDHWDLAYARCRAVVDALAAEGVDPRRMRLAVAGPHDPLEAEGDAPRTKQDSRVEIRVLNEWVKEPAGEKHK